MPEKRNTLSNDEMVACVGLPFIFELYVKTWKIYL